MIGASVENGAVKVVTRLSDFRAVVADMGKVPGISELAETAIPHHFRYANSKSLEFFGEYDEKTIKKINSERAAGVRNANERTDSVGLFERLRIGVVSRDSDIPDALARNDVLISFGGDSFLRNRPGVITSKFGCLFREAVHLDVRADMEHDIYDESICGGPGAGNLLALGRERLMRVMELSHMTGVKPDIVSRVTPGKLNTFLHMAAAKRSGMVIPDIKKHIEEPKTLAMLRKMDKGGTIFYPRPGMYENVAKCDFSSMYPNIIVKYNISPERMHCTCCADEAGTDARESAIVVPESGWRICRKPGLIPQGIGAVLKRRLELKKAMRAESEPIRRRELDLRQKALKNILVCSFGYLGFKNFIFSNVECKECVMLYGRHILARTKRIAEDEGLEVIYGIVDSVFVRGGGERGGECGGRSGERYRRFVSRVSEEFGFELELDCVFTRIAFPSSDDGSGVANKYYGITTDGKIEARGIALRHSDAPEFTKEFQEKAIRALLGFGGVGETNELVREYSEKLKNKEIPLESLSITKKIRKSAYSSNQAHVVAYRLAREGARTGRGTRISDGRHIAYVFTAYGPKPLHMAHHGEIDARKYCHLLQNAAQELILGLDMKAMAAAEEK